MKGFSGFGNSPVKKEEVKVEKLNLNKKSKDTKKDTQPTSQKIENYEDTLPADKNVLGQLRDLNKKFENTKKEAKKLGISIYKMKKAPVKNRQKRISDRRQAMLDRKANIKAQMQKDFYGV